MVYALPLAAPLKFLVRRKVHGFMDNKNFPLPLTEAQRKRLRTTRVTGHLRKPSEGTSRGFTKPRDNHSLTGIPSVNIAAAVAKNRVIMWTVCEGPWNGRWSCGLIWRDLLFFFRLARCTLEFHSFINNLVSALLVFCLWRPPSSSDVNSQIDRRVK